MARPKKATVDYFPHDTNHGATIQVLESRWGNDGYAFWFKLLELLGSHDHHYIDCRKPAEWEFLTAKTRVNEETATAILESLCRLDAIDAHLWLNYRVIFCENFIARVEDAYKKRRDSLPTKKTVYTSLNVVLEGFPVPETPLQRVSGTGSTERERERERESKGDQTKPLLLGEKRSEKTTLVEQAFLESFDKNAEKIRQLFPLADFEIQQALCVAHYRDGPFRTNPYEFILKWFSRIPKGGHDGSGLAGRTKASGRKAQGIAAPNGPDADWLGGSQFAPH